MITRKLWAFMLILRLLACFDVIFILFVAFCFFLVVFKDSLIAILLVTQYLIELHPAILARICWLSYVFVLRVVLHGLQGVERGAAVVTCENLLLVQSLCLLLRL